MIKVKINLGNKSYPLFIGTQILEKVGEACSLYGIGKRVAVVTNTTLDKLYWSRLTKSFTKRSRIFKIIINDEERYKTLKIVEQLLSRLLQEGYRQDFVIVAFGNEVVCNIAGFLAATFMGGIPLVQIPSSLLAQVDASVGDKVTLNFDQTKDAIVSYRLPKLIWVDVALLKSLSNREFLSGLGEVVKWGITTDEHFFTFLEENLQTILDLDSEVLEKVIARCCQIKAELLGKGQNGREILDFGHPVGQALEEVTKFRRFKHGEAVILGMLAEGKMAVNIGAFSKLEFERLQRLLERIGINLRSKNVNIIDLRDRIIANCQTEKGGKIKFILPKRIGEVFLTENIDKRTITSGLRYIGIK